MDTYADSYTSYRADQTYRREQLVAGVTAGRATRRARRAVQAASRLARAERRHRLTRAAVARSA